MEDQPGVTIDFTIKGADPKNKIDPDERCETCGRPIIEHTTREMVRACFRKPEPSEQRL